MEQLPYSLEKAGEEAQKLTKLTRAGLAESHNEAEKKLSIFFKRERDPKEFAKYEAGIDAGHYFEEMALELFEEIPGIMHVFLTSMYDDQKIKIGKTDLIICFNNGKKIAIQVSGTESTDKYIEKCGDLVAKPILTELHNDEAEVIHEEVIPRGIALCNKLKWGKAYNRHLEKKSGKKSGELLDREKEKIELLSSVIKSIEDIKIYKKTKIKEHKKNLGKDASKEFLEKEIQDIKIFDDRIELLSQCKERVEASL